MIELYVTLYAPSFTVMTMLLIFAECLPQVFSSCTRQAFDTQENLLQSELSLVQGIVMTEPAIYVLKSGTVEFKRYRQTGGSHNRDSQVCECFNQATVESQFKAS